MTRRPSIHLGWRQAALAIAAAASLVVTGTLTIANAGGPPPPFFKSGTNGFSAPSNGAATMINEGRGGQGALLTSIGGATNQAGYGLVGFPGGPGTATTFGGLTDVETQFNVTQGTCVGGAPRWVIDLSNPNNPKDTQFLTVYFDNEHQAFGGCNPGTLQESNIINNPSTGWFVGNANGPTTYGQVNATYGDWKLKDVEVVVDAGWDHTGQLNENIQQVLLQKFTVNNDTAFRLPS